MQICKTRVQISPSPLLNVVYLEDCYRNAHSKNNYNTKFVTLNVSSCTPFKAGTLVSAIFVYNAERHIK